MAGAYQAEFLWALILLCSFVVVQPLTLIKKPLWDFDVCQKFPLLCTFTIDNKRIIIQPVSALCLHANDGARESGSTSGCPLQCDNTWQGKYCHERNVSFHSTWPRVVGSASGQVVSTALVGFSSDIDVNVYVDNVPMNVINITDGVSVPSKKPASRALHTAANLQQHQQQFEASHVGQLQSQQTSSPNNVETSVPPHVLSGALSPAFLPLSPSSLNRALSDLASQTINKAITAGQSLKLVVALTNLTSTVLAQIASDPNIERIGNQISVKNASLLSTDLFNTLLEASQKLLVPKNYTFPQPFKLIEQIANFTNMRSLNAKASDGLSRQLARAASSGIKDHVSSSLLQFAVPSAYFSANKTAARVRNVTIVIQNGEEDDHADEEETDIPIDSKSTSSSSSSTTESDSSVVTLSAVELGDMFEKEKKHLLVFFPFIHPSDLGLNLHLFGLLPDTGTGLELDTPGLLTPNPPAVYPVGVDCTKGCKLETSVPPLSLPNVVSDTLLDAIGRNNAFTLEMVLSPASDSYGDACRAIFALTKCDLNSCNYPFIGILQGCYSSEGSKTLTIKLLEDPAFIQKDDTATTLTFLNVFNKTAGHEYHIVIGIEATTEGVAERANVSVDGVLYKAAHTKSIINSFSHFKGAPNAKMHVGSFRVSSDRVSANEAKDWSGTLSRLALWSKAVPFERMQQLYRHSMPLYQEFSSQHFSTTITLSLSLSLHAPVEPAALNCSLGTFYSKSSKKCESCPEGATCTVTDGTSCASAGYVSKDEYSKPEQCLLKKACPDTKDLGDSADECIAYQGVCETAYTGFGCSTCDDGYFQDGIQCKECPKESVMYTMMVAMLIVCALMGIGTAVLNDLWLDRYVSTIIFLQQIILVGKAASTHVNAGWVSDIFLTLSVVNFDRDFIQPGCAFGSCSFIGLFWATVILVFCAFFIFLLAAALRALFLYHVLKRTALEKEAIRRQSQIATQAQKVDRNTNNNIASSSSYSSALVVPTSTKAATTTTTIPDANSSSSSSSSSDTSSSHFSGPSINIDSSSTAHLTASTPSLPAIKETTSNTSEDTALYTPEKLIPWTTHMKNRLTRALIIMGFVFYLQCATLCFRALSCRRLQDDNSLVLTYQMSQQCFEGLHVPIIVVVFLVIPVYILGFPLSLFAVLTKMYRAKQLLNAESEWAEQFGYAYRGCKPHYYWFRLISSFFASLVLAFAYSFNRSIGVSMFMYVLVFALLAALVASLRPFDRSFTTALNTASPLAISVYALFSLFSMDDDAGATSSMIVFACVWAAVLFLITLTVYIVGCLAVEREKSLTAKLASKGNDSL